MEDEQFDMIAKTLFGLEDILAEELRALGADAVETGRRMVSFKGDKAMLYKANFHCRTALRILKPVAHFRAENADEVYEAVKAVEWEQYLSPERTFAVEAVIYSENFRHSKFVAYRTKDAIADRFMERTGQRPSVRLSNPDMAIHIHISHNECTLALDSSGESLHKRGYRVTGGEAPLNEVLAAGMILMTGWRGQSHFVDPMCGSGTLLIEAAMIALNIPPGIYRKAFAFERWADFDPDLFDAICNDDSAERDFDFLCHGADISAEAIRRTEQNVRSAGLSRHITLRNLPFQQFTRAPQPAILVTNPPYGERIATDNVAELYGMIGERLKHVFMGCQAWILSYRDECFDHIGLRPSQKISLMNGELTCEYRCYELFAGTNKDYRKAQSESPSPRHFDRPEGDEQPERGERRERFDRPERKQFERPERGERRERFDRPERKQFERPGRGERRERFERPERKEFERPERGERRERFDRPERKQFERPERGERRERFDRPERKQFDRPGRGERWEQFDRPERKQFERPERGERRERFERPERKEFDRPDRGERRERFERPERKQFERPERGERRERFDRPERKEFDRPERGERPERRERINRPDQSDYKAFAGKPRISRRDIAALREAIDKPDAVPEREQPEERSLKKSSLAKQ